MATATASPTPKADLQQITGIVIELHPKSGETWSRAKLRTEDGRTIWLTCKFRLALQEVLTAKCTFNQKFKSYDVVSLMDEGDGKVSNGVVILKLVELLDGVGKIKAQRLGETFPDLYDAIQESPEAIAKACGAHLEDVQTVANQLKEERANLSRVSALTNLGYPNHLAKQIAPADGLYRVAIESPYAAIRLVSGLGWLLADEVGRKMGIKVDDPKRIVAGIDHYYVTSVASDGHTRVAMESLLSPEALPQLLGVGKDLIEEQVRLTLIPVEEGWYTSEFHKRNAETIAGFFYRN